MKNPLTKPTHSYLLDAANARIAELESNYKTAIDAWNDEITARQAANARADAAERACVVLSPAVDGWKAKCEAAERRYREGAGAHVALQIRAESEAAALRAEVERWKASCWNQGTLTVVAESSLADARALLVRARDCQDDSEPFAIEIDDWLVANPEVKS